MTKRRHSDVRNSSNDINRFKIQLKKFLNCFLKRSALTYIYSSFSG